MNTKQVILSLILALVVGIAIGRFTLPAKIVTKTETKTDTTTQQAKIDNSVTTITETKKPDGSEQTVTVIDNHIDTTTHHTAVSDTKTDKEVTYDTKRWSIGLAATAHPLSSLHPTITYGGEVTYRILGPFQVGGMGFTDGTLGVILGITF